MRSSPAFERTATRSTPVILLVKTLVLLRLLARKFRVFLVAVILQRPGLSRQPFQEKEIKNPFLANHSRHFLSTLCLLNFALSAYSSPLITMAAAAPPKTTGSPKLDGAIQKIAASEPQKLSGVALYSRFVRTDLALKRKTS